jgi:Xaa-Pro dipeptidase
VSEILEKTRKAMAEKGYEALLVSSPENVAYVGGVSPPSQRIVRSRHAFVLIPADGTTHYITIQLEAGLVRRRSTADEVHVYREFVQHPVKVAADLVRTVGASDARIGIETSHLPADDVALLKKELRDAELVSADRDLEHLRLVKTADELETIRRIGRVAEQAAATAIEEARVGNEERDIGNRITEIYLGGGGEALTMLVVGTGERSAEPNAPPTNKKIQSGDLIRVDVIGTMNNYYSDVARTAVAGDATEEQQKIWGLLRDLRNRAIEAMKPGVSTSDVYRIYQEAMDAAGLPKYHFLGHGLGVTLHEEPFLSAIHDVRLEPGMVMCVEPLCLFENRFGMQLEDEVLITNDGSEPLTNGGPLLRIGG